LTSPRHDGDHLAGRSERVRHVRKRDVSSSTRKWAREDEPIERVSRQCVHLAQIGEHGDPVVTCVRPQHESLHGRARKIQPKFDELISAVRRLVNIAHGPSDGMSSCLIPHASQGAHETTRESRRGTHKKNGRTRRANWSISQSPTYTRGIR
jgi:hypothetical protein